MGVVSLHHRHMLHWMASSTASTTLLSCSRKKAATVILQRQLPWRKILNPNPNQSQKMSQNQKQKKNLINLLHKTNSRILIEPSGDIIRLYPNWVLTLFCFHSSLMKFLGLQGLPVLRLASQFKVLVQINVILIDMESYERETKIVFVFLSCIEKSSLSAGKFYLQWGHFLYKW